MRGSACILAVSASLFHPTPTHTQEIQLREGDGAQLQARRQHVEPLTASLQVKAGRPAWVELRFRVQPGFHINSHTPHDELLVPTTLDLTASSGTRLAGQLYPPGLPLRLDAAGGETLSTYQGEFAVRVQVAAPRGEAELRGTLSYQACDARSCFPPRKLPLQVSIHAE